MRELVAGNHFAGYLIEGVLGRGGMGVVYRGRRQTALADRAVALKVMRPEHALDERFAARFREEARRAAALEHPAIVPVYDADEWQGVPYIAMRLVVGRDLASLIETRGPQPTEVVLRIAADVAGALDAAHAAGVVHRDVKPRNILIDAAGHAYLTDFGLVRAAGGGDGGHTAVGAIVGTLAYIAPEQTQSGAAVDGRADQYALACTLFEALADQPPFRGETDRQLVLAHRAEPPPAVSQFAPAAAALDAPLERAMAKEPADRFASCGELADALHAALAAPPGTARDPARRGATNIAEPTAPLIGREDDLDRIEALLVSGSDRLLTLTGTGGIGKTTLARAAARRAAVAYPDGAVEVALAPLRHDEMIVPAIGRALEISDAGDLTARTLGERIADRRLLLLLDNAEHLAGVASVVHDLLGAAPDIRLLVTSRAPLRLSVEQEYAVAALGAPRDDVDVDAASVALFARRARRVRADFAVGADNAAAVVGICRRTDGIPLAIELAAAQAKLLSPAAVLELLEQRVPLPLPASADTDTRHATMHAAVGWSYELLDARDRDLLDRLSVYVSGFSFEDAAAIADRDLPGTLESLARLLDHSLIERAGDDRMRLLEPVRQFAAHQLAHDPVREREVRRRFALHLAAVAVDIQARLLGSGWLSGHQRVAVDCDNFVAAAEFAIDDDLAVAATIAANITPALDNIGLAPVKLLLERIAPRRDELSPDLRGLVMAGVGDARSDNGDRAGAEAAYLEAVPLLEEAGRPGDAAIYWHCLAVMAHIHGDADAAETAIERAVELARRSDREEFLAPPLLVAYMIWARRAPDRADAALREGLTIARRIGNEWFMTLGCQYQGFTLMEAGRYDEACAAFVESNAHCPEFARVTLTFNDCNLAQAHALGGQWDAAQRSLSAALRQRMRIGHPIQHVECLVVAAALSAIRGEAALAISLVAAATRAATDVAVEMPPQLQQLLDRVVDPAAQTLPVADRERARAAGGRWTLDRALREADRLVGIER